MKFITIICFPNEKNRDTLLLVLNRVKMCVLCTLRTLAPPRNFYTSWISDASNAFPLNANACAITTGRPRGCCKFVHRRYARLLLESIRRSKSIPKWRCSCFPVFGCQMQAPIDLYACTVARGYVCHTHWFRATTDSLFAWRPIYSRYLLTLVRMR